jgi:hypothetical protein
MGIIDTYNGNSVATYLLAESAYSGVYDLHDRELSRFYTVGNSRPHTKTLRFITAPLEFECELLGYLKDRPGNLASLKGILMPDNDYHPLVVTGRTGQQIQALCMGFPLPQNAGKPEWRFKLMFEVFPYWEDVTEQTTHIDTGSAVVANSGQQPTYPTYTCAVSSAMAAGLSFVVSGQTWLYTGALAPGDSLVVEADDDCPDVKLNGVRVWQNVASSSKNYPALAIGNNTITLSDYTKFHMTVTWRRRYL